MPDQKKKVLKKSGPSGHFYVKQSKASLLTDKGIRANTLACQKPCVVRLALTLLSVCYPLFSVPPAAGQSQIEPTRALANCCKPRGSRFARPSGRTWSNLRPLECVNISVRKLDFDGVCKLKNQHYTLQEQTQGIQVLKTAKVDCNEGL